MNSLFLMLVGCRKLCIKTSLDSNFPYSTIPLFPLVLTAHILNLQPRIGRKHWRGAFQPTATRNFPLRLAAKPGGGVPMSPGLFIRR